MPLAPPLTGVAGTLPIPNTTPTPAPGELVRAEDVQQAAQGLLNQDATIARHLDGTAYLDVVKMNGRTVRRRARVLLSDADHTIKVTDGDVFELDPTPAAGRVITLSMTAPIPEEGETLRFICPGLTNANTYQFQRTGPVLIASLLGNALGNATQSVEFEFTGGVWRMGMNSGWNQTETQGVLAGPGA